MDDKDDIIDLNKLTGEDSQGDEFSIDHVEPDEDVNVIGSIEQVSEYEFNDLDAAIDEFAPIQEKLGKKHGIEAVAVGEQTGVADRVRIKFDKFVTLVATHTYEDILKRNADQDVIISTDLLTDLANAHEEETGSKKTPVLFAAGIVLGILIAWLIFR